MTQKALLDRLELEVRDQLEQARTQLAPLPADALLARPGGPASKKRESQPWNALECLAHLNAFCDAYFAQIELAIHKSKARRWIALGNDELRYTARGRRAIRRAEPANGRRYKSAGRYNFAQQALGADIVKSFIINAEKMLRLLQAAREVDLNRATVRKAHAWTARYTLGNLLEFLVTHQGRHLSQAQRILTGS